MSWSTAPHVNLYADTALLGKLADGVVLVVQANSTHREVARKAKESLDSREGSAPGGGVE